MNRRTALALLAAPAGAGLSGRLAPRPQSADAWTPLFNGRDLDGWETFLGKPHRSANVPGLARNEAGEYAAPAGVDRDPTGVFSVVQIDGAPAIRISGEIYGALTTRAEYDNYHLRFAFKWGERRWPPREQLRRDSGCCYHGAGPHGASYGYWLRSFEFQIQEEDCGDFYGLAGVIVDVEALPVEAGNPKSELVFTKGAPKIVGHTKRVIRSQASEKPLGAWNVMELYCVGQTSAHVVKGTVNMILSGHRYRVDGREVPQTKGRIQFQSEGAEVFYRDIALRRIDEMPRGIASGRLRDAATARSTA